MKTAKLLALVLSTAISITSTTVSATAAIPVSNVTLKSNNNFIAFTEDVKNIHKAVSPPFRKAVEERFENVWYASLYDGVKQDIDNRYADRGYRFGEYVRICRIIAKNQGRLPNFGGGPIEAFSNQINLSVREENGVVNCYDRIANW